MLITMNEDLLAQILEAIDQTTNELEFNMQERPPESFKARRDLAKRISTSRMLAADLRKQLRRHGKHDLAAEPPAPHWR